MTEHLEIDEPVDFVYHFAALASPVDYLRMPLHSLKVGSYGTHHALGLAKFKRARFLLASTSEVYGDPQVHPQPETYWGHVNPIGPRGVYDEAKRYAEALTMAYHNQQGVDTAIVRIFNTYGPRMRPHDGRAIPTFVRQALANEPLTVYGDGSQTRSFCYVDDLIRGLVLLAESGEHLPRELGNPTRVHDPRARPGRPQSDRLDERDRLRGAAGRRSAGAPAGHHPGDAGARLGARDRARGRAPADARQGAGRCVTAGAVLAAAAAAAAAALAVPAFTAGAVDRDADRHLRRGRDVLRRRDARPSPATGAARAGAPGQPLLGREARRRQVPARSTPPTRATPAYDWSLYDHVAAYAGAYGIKLLFSIIGTPRLGERRRELEPPAARTTQDLRNFAYAAAARYSGTYIGPDGRTHSGGAAVGRVERAEQPGLPPAAVRPAGAGSG